MIGINELKYDEIKALTSVAIMEKSKGIMEASLPKCMEKDAEYQKSIS